MRSDAKKYGKMLADLENQHLLGNNKYPSNINDAFNILLNYKTPPGSTRSTQVEESEGGYGVAFAQTVNTIAGDDGIVHEGITCYNCNSKGHYSSSCPEKNNDDSQVVLFQIGGNTEEDEVEEMSFMQTVVRDVNLSFSKESNT